MATRVSDEFYPAKRRNVSCCNRRFSSRRCHLATAHVGVKTNPRCRRYQAHCSRRREQLLVTYDGYSSPVITTKRWSPRQPEIPADSFIDISENTMTQFLFFVFFLINNHFASVCLSHPEQETSHQKGHPKPLSLTSEEAK